MGLLVSVTDELEAEFDDGKDDDNGVEDVEAIGTVAPPAQSDEFGDELDGEESSEDDVGDGEKKLQTVRHAVILQRQQHRVQDDASEEEV